MSEQSIETVALALPESARAALAQKLLASLGEPSIDEIQDMWAREAERRASQIDAGQVELISSEEAAHLARQAIA